MQMLEGHRVVVLNVRVARPWEGRNNAMLGQEIRNYPYAVLVDWHAASADHPEYFWKDGVHLRPAGARVYASLIAAAVQTP